MSQDISEGISTARWHGVVRPERLPSRNPARRALKANASGRQLSFSLRERADDCLGASPYQKSLPALRI